MRAGQTIHNVIVAPLTMRVYWERSTSRFFHSRKYMLKTTIFVSTFTFRRFQAKKPS